MCIKSNMILYLQQSLSNWYLSSLHCFHCFILFYFILFYFILSFCVLGPHPQHIEVPRPGVQSELQLPTYTTATATRDMKWLSQLHHSSQQCRILNPLSKARDRTLVHMDASWVHQLLSHSGNSPPLFQICLNLHFCIKKIMSISCILMKIKLLLCKL